MNAAVRVLDRRGRSHDNVRRGSYHCDAWPDRVLRVPHRNWNIPMVMVMLMVMLMVGAMIRVGVGVRVRVLVPAGTSPIGFKRPTGNSPIGWPTTGDANRMLVIPTAQRRIAFLDNIVVASCRNENNGTDEKRLAGGCRAEITSRAGDRCGADDAPRA